jgi:hypothetical protein
LRCRHTHVMQITPGTSVHQKAGAWLNLAEGMGSFSASRLLWCLRCGAISLPDASPRWTYPEVTRAAIGLSDAPECGIRVRRAARALRRER